jgi:hypothetical protein
MMKTNDRSTSQYDDLIKYFPNGDVQINLDCILTEDHILTPGMMLIKVEGQHVDVIKLLGVRNTHYMVYLKVKDMKTKHVYEISQRLDPDENLFVWWVTSYQFAASAIEDRVIEELKGTKPY